MRRTVLTERILPLGLFAVLPSRPRSIKHSRNNFEGVEASAVHPSTPERPIRSISTVSPNVSTPLGLWGKPLHAERRQRARSAPSDRTHHEPVVAKQRRQDRVN